MTWERVVGAVFLQTVYILGETQAHCWVLHMHTSAFLHMSMLPNLTEKKIIIT